MASRLPKSITVDGVEYAILYCDRIIARGEVCEGVCDPEERYILIARTVHGKKQTHERIMEVIEHEKAHAELFGNLGEAFACAREQQMALAHEEARNRNKET